MAKNQPKMRVQSLSELSTISKSCTERLADFFHPEGHVSARSTRTHASYPTRHPAELTGIPGIHHLQAWGVTITTRADPEDATFDGEVRGQTPLQVQVADEQLIIVVPAMAG